MNIALAALRRHAGVLTFLLSILIVVLLIAVASRHELVSASWLAAHKDALLALNSIVTMCVLLVGAVFSYYRFFRGRTLSARAELSLDITVHSTPAGFLIHACTLTAKNVGSTTIWNPQPAITLHMHGPDGDERGIRITDWVEEPGEGVNVIAVVDPGEAVTFFTTQRLPATTWAVTYVAALTTDEGDTWHVARTVSNKE